LFNDKITKQDLEYLDNLYKTAYSAESMKFWADEFNDIVGSLDEPEEMLAYLHKVEELNKDDDSFLC
jgi:hypothetical protein